MSSNSIEFVLNNKIIKIENPDPNETILNYVRLNLKKTGTKEGCAEGGCGACTIVLGEIKNNDILYKSINSCITFLPVLNGKQLILIESLSPENGKLHVVQNAMVNFHGSQCGFCTPGFVMSMFAMFKNNKIINNELINDSLSGNLCRCTGYRPIIDASKSLNNLSRKDHFDQNKKITLMLLKKIAKKNIEISKNSKTSRWCNYCTMR
jgi:xanthine dehydrogenase small subunit